MRRGALVIAGTVALLAGGPVAADDRPPFGFDHLVHDGRVTISGADPVPCQDCHRLRPGGTLAGRPDHGSCFVRCHADAAPAPRRRGRPYPIAETQRELCETCHAPAALRAAEAGRGPRLAVPYPPYTIDPDYGIALSHAVHQKAGARCAGCHEPARTGRSPAAHGRCGSCHGAADGAAPAITRCDTCHRPAYGPARAPHLAAGPYRTGTMFSHARHAARGARCLPCHQAIAGTDDLALPGPKTSQCVDAGCHDGLAAFSTTGASCTRCHPVPSFAPARTAPPTRFAHGAHATRGMDLACARCHALDDAGAPLPPARDHAPCSDAGCHAVEFVTREPRICGACHLSVEPWHALHADRPPPPDTEFGARFSHAAHLGPGAPLAGAACGSCHRTADATRDRRLPRDHVSCTGSGCHDGGDDGARPRLADCGGCHQPGLLRARRAQRLADRWSVRRSFTHRPHTRDAAGRPLSCDTCHAGIAATTGIEDIRAPGKDACRPCHDGGIAFKVTGHDCARCHDPPARR